MLHTKLLLRKTTLEDSNTIDLLYKVAKEDQVKKHIWNLSDNSVVWENHHSFREYLSRDFGQYHLYIAQHGNICLGIFGMLNLSDCAGCANILVWLNKSVRQGLYAIKWFVLFLEEAQKRQVYRWYAKIKLSNKVSLHSAERYGFSPCPQIPDHLNTKTVERISVQCVSRDTSFNDFERKYICRYFPGTKNRNAERIRLDCVRNEPQSEPFVGQARLLYRKHLFWGWLPDQAEVRQGLFCCRKYDLCNSVSWYIRLPEAEYGIF